MVSWKPFDMPCGIEAVLRRCAKESKRDGFVSCTAQFGDGRVEYVSLFDTEGNQHYIRPNGSRWLKMHDKEGEMSANSNYPMGVNGSHPYFNQPDPPECMNSKCNATLETEWEFCPYCGMHIDWDAYEHDGDDWYAEESADYLHKEVFEPIIARWGE